MKNIKIRKSYDLSPNSKIFFYTGLKKLHIKGFGLYTISVDPGDEIYASHLWTKSKKIAFDELTDGASYIIKPRMGKLFGFIVLFIFTICTGVFIFTKYRWSYLPLVPVIFYIALYLTILKERYLIIKSVEGE